MTPKRIYPPSLLASDEQHAALIDVDEQRDVVVSALGGGLADGDATHFGEVCSVAGGFDPVVQYAPHAGVVLAHETPSGGDRHCRHQRHGERLEQEREA